MGVSQLLQRRHFIACRRENHEFVDVADEGPVLLEEGEGRRHGGFAVEELVVPRQRHIFAGGCAERVVHVVAGRILRRPGAQRRLAGVVEGGDNALPARIEGAEAPYSSLLQLRRAPC
ncbi:acyl-CoA dehydrogenase [Babesia caballi]|uniref:Acyl-CoA dehydrogenase n=1 Tax=Babesia caballi TaxID=5871 RepID=A0AAV4LWK5_BABCB|nr:acyl-CoA dehydrogenase [Babesia caballi]